MDAVFLLAIAIAIFLVVFVRTEFGLYLVIFSMLLSPQFGSGGQALAEGRRIVIRSEDVLLLVVAFSWFAKTAVNKELGLAVKTPLNRPITIYIAVTAIATLVGYASGTVHGLGGLFYVLKYVEYFVVYYMVVNNLGSRPQAWRLVSAAFLTAAIVSLIGAAQIPSGERVSAPFEGREGEPNTFGGYLLFMMAIVGGLAIETRRLRTRALSLGLLALMGLPFAYTLSRASFLGVPFVLGAMARFSTRRRLVTGLLVLAIVGSPALLVILPTPVTQRILYTFRPEAGQATVRLGRIAFDPSTSARLISVEQALEGWTKRPLLGYGVTGFGFMDAQYARTLVETGIVGLAAFLALVWSLARAGLGTLRAVEGDEERGLALGFVAGLAGLLVHAVGANTFIIVRVMEPFWFFAAVVVALPHLAPEDRPAAPTLPARASGQLA